MAVKVEILCNLFLMKVGCKAEVLGENPAPSTTMSTTNPALRDLGIEFGPPRQEPGAATNSMSYGTTLFTTSELQAG
jgi:hypothetical protein